MKASDKRKSQGKCLGCGNRVDSIYSICSECREKRRKKYRLNILNGMCGYCGNRPVDKGLNSCSVCKKKNHSKNRNKVYMERQRTIRISKRQERESDGICTECGKNPKSGFSRDCTECRDKRLSKNRKLASNVIIEYGSRCVCCGESNPMMLTIDHIDNDGKNHRYRNGRYRVGGTALYKLLAEQSFPKDKYQLLCYNCNIGKYKNGGTCPHILIASVH